MPTNLFTPLMIFVVLGFLGGIILFFTFMSKKNEGKFTGFAGWLHKFLNFKILFAESLLKALYVILACILTLVSFVILFSGLPFGAAFLAFLVVLVIGNVVVRILYEFSLLKLIVAQNTSEINAKLGGGAQAAPAEPAPYNPPPAAPYNPPPAYTPAAPYNPPPAYTPPPADVTVSQFCPSCGTPVGGAEQFCPKCGTKLR